jgi:hypothetical protein
MTSVFASVGCLMLFGQPTDSNDKSAQLTVTQWPGDRSVVAKAAIACGCKSRANRESRVEEYASHSRSHVFLHTGAFTAVLPQSAVKSISFDRPTGRKLAPWETSASAVLVDGTVLRVRMRNQGPICGEVAGRAVEIPLIGIRAIENEGSLPREDFLAKSPGTGAADLNTGRETWIRLRSAGFYSDLGCPSHCTIPPKLSDRFRDTKGREVFWNEIRSVGRHVASSARPRPGYHALDLTLKTGERQSVEARASDGVLGVARVGTLDVLVLVPFDAHFYLRFE